mmetsp:Transcript_13718/g.33279  ORF Transcript_13718/g.33279 Transcript_13718/m.33279 type:complete len:254 (-) Transcript_13718:54-815(-)
MTTEAWKNSAASWIHVLTITCSQATGNCWRILRDGSSMSRRASSGWMCAMSGRCREASLRARPLRMMSEVASSPQRYLRRFSTSEGASWLRSTRNSSGPPDISVSSLSLPWRNRIVPCTSTASPRLSEGVLRVDAALPPAAESGDPAAGAPPSNFLSDADLILKLPFLVIAWNGLKPSWSPGRPAGSCCPASSGEPRSSSSGGRRTAVVGFFLSSPRIMVADEGCSDSAPWLACAKYRSRSSLLNRHFFGRSP